MEEVHSVFTPSRAKQSSCHGKVHPLQRLCRFQCTKTPWDLSFAHLDLSFQIMHLFILTNLILPAFEDPAQECRVIKVGKVSIVADHHSDTLTSDELHGGPDALEVFVVAD